MWGGGGGKYSSYYVWWVVLALGRETREGWPLTVDNEENGDSWSTHERVLPWFVYWIHRAGTIEFCPALAALVSPVKNIIFLTALFYFAS